MEAPLFQDLVINGERVPHTAIAAETQNQNAPRAKAAMAWRKAANAVAIRTLLLQEARARGIEADCRQVGPGRFETEDEALIRGLLDQVIDVPEPTPDEVRAEWQKNPDRFRSPPLWEVSHILCACASNDPQDRRKAFDRAMHILATVEDDPKSFASVAAVQSDCGSKTSGGALGQLGPGDTVPEFEAALRHLGDGEVAPKPVETRHGFHVIRMDAIAQGRVLPFEAVREAVASAMERADWARQARSFVDGLVAVAQIEGADLSVKGEGPLEP
ncbi:peptidase [Notoacmeibacter marinus]|uniref:Parvulin-like PPIase n=1 Tax=Notoacmeibacter marinus TaxID=1876515 RepID=A0A231V1T2_9HYPH|nr:peptidylprolyl isomerase [Notoacmeibacter marinus]OXT02077.1 peptidase [Notoacmeibacter marinus]